MSHRLHSPHNPKPQPGHFNNSTTRRPRSEKPLQTSGSRTFLSFSCFSIANQETVGRSAELLVQVKALALQKRPFFVTFAVGEEPPPSWMSQYYAQYRVRSAKQGNYLKLFLVVWLVNILSKTSTVETEVYTEEIFSCSSILSQQDRLSRQKVIKK